MSLRAREIRNIIKASGQEGSVPPVVIRLLEALAEDHSVLRQENLALANLIEQLARNITQHGHVIHKIMDNLSPTSRIKKIRGVEDDSGES